MVLETGRPIAGVARVVMIKRAARETHSGRGGHLVRYHEER